MTTTPMPLAEAARQLGISPKTLRRLIGKRKIAAIQYIDRGKIFIDPDELERFKNGSTTPIKEPPKPPTKRLQPLAPDMIPRSNWGRSG